MYQVRLVRTGFLFVNGCINSIKECSVQQSLLIFNFRNMSRLWHGMSTIISVKQCCERSGMPNADCEDVSSIVATASNNSFSRQDLQEYDTLNIL